MRVMMSAAASPASVSIIGHLKSLGHQVVGLDANENAEQLGRAFCDEFYVCPLAISSDYLDFVCRKILDVDVFLPFVDEELFALANAWGNLPSSITRKIALSDPGVVLDCLDKQRFQMACVKKGLNIAPEVKFSPAFFKPRYGRGGRGVLSLDDQSMYDAVKDRDGVIQRKVLGTEYTVDAIFDRVGNFLVAIPRKRLSAAGVSTIGEVVHDDQLSELAKKLGNEWRFRYAINFQVIRDSEGKDWLIELNPRLAGSAIFSTLAGCDPFDATVTLSQGGTWVVTQPKPLKVWRYWSESVAGN